MLIAFLALLFGGFLLAMVAGISYFCSHALPSRQRISLGLLCLTPLISLLLLYGGLFVSGRQLISLFPCVAGGIFFLVLVMRGSPSAFSIAPMRALSAGAGFLWAGGAAYLSSDYGFMGASC